MDAGADIGEIQRLGDEWSLFFRDVDGMELEVCALADAYLPPVARRPVPVDVQRAAEPQPLVGYIEQTVVEQVPEPPVPLDHRHRAHRLQPNRRGALRQEDAATEREREHEAVVEDLEPPRDEMALRPGREREDAGHWMADIQPS